MRNCANCGKANQPTRKYCIRCGRSLISKSPPKQKTSKPLAELGKVTTAETIKQEEMAAAAAAKEPEPVEEDEWVKPSEVSKDRVRTGAGKKRLTEFEKAQAAFAAAEEVGIEEDESGVVVTRMLRASEVKELMEGVAEMPAAEAPNDDEPIVGPPPIAAPSAQDIEEQILGSKSAFVDKPIVEPEPEIPVTKDSRVAPELASDFTSSKYEEIEAKTVPAEAVSPPVPTPAPAPVVEPPKPAETPPELSSTDMDYDSITACPSCGEVINVDTFEYPREIYSAMGAARMKQARFFVVQGKYDEAQKIVRIARLLYTKASDDGGIAEVSKLVDSLSRRG
ncbi:MAG: hypothetical protein ACXAEF_09555 [Candidatus Thorarchaeota archaeon]|jgi:hypothetical protein